MYDNPFAHLYMNGFCVELGCQAAYVFYGTGSPSRCEWLVPGTFEC